MQQRNEEKILDGLKKVRQLCPHRSALPKKSKIKEEENAFSSKLQKELNEQQQPSHQQLNENMLLMRKLVQTGRAEREDEELKHQRQRERRLVRYNQRVRERSRHL